MLFDGKPTTGSDIWALACTMFELRAGIQLFASFFDTEDEIIRQIVQAFGKLPEPWWSAWKKRPIYFDDEGKPNQVWPNNIRLAIEYPLEAQIRDIGAEDENSGNQALEELDRRHQYIFESPGTRLSPAEAADFKDLLEKMLRYRHGDRIQLEEIRKHAWLSNVYQ
ncbi:CMGC SRPK protein kinase [Aspergillus sclerotialis]|uniref:CMGC SRPK protein kinase n=1 Tax=Aspergillus sclerotialis TaxID=2070753 RepID=A0A3A2ZKW6_9EURO|nr:CMGC SRPK protein kinase [Aspergillus sclerotialis]